MLRCNGRPNGLARNVPKPRRHELLVPPETIERRVYLIRGHKVMIDSDLAKLYGIATRVLNQAVRRNLDRFPADFMFQLSKSEFRDWRSQFVTSNSASRMGLRRAPLVFTEHGILMLSSVLRSKRAVQVNIAIMRTFIKLRELLATHKDLSRRLDDLEERYDAQFKVVFDAIRKLIEPPPDPVRRRIGFQVGKR
jgi:hypothetical protein